MRQRSPHRTGWTLVLPLLVFTLVTFLAPIGFMLWKSVYDPEVAGLLGQTRQALAKWQTSTGLPGPEGFDALSRDLRDLTGDGRVSQLALRLNRERSGMRQLIEVTADAIAEYDRPLLEIDPRWGDPDTWVLLKRMTQPLTARYFLSAVDLQQTPQGSIVRQDESRRIYVYLFGRTILVASVVTAVCIILGYPFAYALATARPRMQRLLFFIVMLPFWTSLLVRTTAWIVLLQRRGVLNEILVAMNIVSERSRLELIYNLSGTLIVMTHVLLPFFVLPLYAVMKGIPKQYVRAGKSLGAGPVRVFLRIYLPMTLPGVLAGAALVFILSLGYYVTPALVGGRTGQLISNQIAFHVQTSLNWGLAAALGSILLVIVVVLTMLLSRVTQRGVL
ncbi:ABC transporter permease [Rhizobium sp. Leaf371]|nr:ABC transporter permease [Rhizobium sp. Leaf371]